MALISPELVSSDPLQEDLVDHLPSEIIETFDAVSKRIIDPLEVGLVEPSPSLLDGVGAFIYTQPRVASWNGEVVEGDIIKIETMYKTTDTGSELEELIQKLVQQGVLNLSTKQISEWRINRPLMRKCSIDELPQLLFNVMGLVPKLFPDRLDMRLFGPARPPLKSEIQYKGDSSNDRFCRALEIVAGNTGLEVREEMYEQLGHIYEPALITPATARGNRQLNTVEDFVAWMKGIIDYAELKEMPQLRRNYIIGRWALSTAKNVITLTDAA